MFLPDRESPDMPGREVPESKPEIDVKHASGTKAPRKSTKGGTSPTKPGKRTPAKQCLQSPDKGGLNPTTKAMAYDWVMKALDGMTSEMKRELAEELGVKQVNLINGWNNNWKKRVEKVLHDEFKGGSA